MGDSMSTIINATTTNGVVIQPDNSGSLQLATNSGTTAVTIDTSQNVGIGTTSPSSFSTSKLVLNQAADGDILFARGGSTRQVQLGTTSTTGYINTDNISGGLTLNVNATERMRIDSSGNVGIGTSSPSAKLDVNGLVYIRSGSYLATNGVYGYDSDVNISTNNSGSQVVKISTGAGAGTERMRILSTGEMLQSRAYSGSGSTNTAFALNTSYLGARIRARGSENGNNNTSYTEYLATWGVGGWVITRTARAQIGNGYGAINLGISGNYITVSFATSNIGQWWANVEYFS